MTHRRPLLDVLLPLAVAGVQLGSAYVVLGTPDLAAARDFLTGTAPSMTGSVAAAQLVLWVALVAALAVALVAGLTRTLGAARSAGRSAMWSIAVVAVGTLILVSGADHRASAGTVTLSGGSLQEARAQLGP